MSEAVKEPIRIYYLFITALVKSYENELCGRLLNLGYTLTAGANSGKINADIYNSAPIFSFSITKAGANESSIFKDVMIVLTAMNAYYYSIVVMERAGTPMWCSTNINFDEPIPTTIQSKKSELN